MKVYRHEIQPRLIDSCIARMRIAPFHGDDLAQIIVGSAADEYAIQARYTIAARLIQRERRAGNIARVLHRPGVWQWLTRPAEES